MDKQASIAATQNKIAESMGRAFVSPSIRIDDASIVIPSKGLNGPKATGYQFQPVVENSGTTPTDGLTFAGAATSCGASAQTWTNELGDKATMGIYPKQMIDVKLEDNKCPDFIKFPDSPTDPEDILKNAVTGRIFLGPHAKTDVGGVEMTPELLRYVIDRGGRWYLSGVLRYHDTFPGTPARVTKYCYILGLTLVADGSLKPHAGLCAHWNCADDECKADRNAYDDEVAKAR